MPGRSILVGAAGEDYVLYRLHNMGWLAAQSPKNAYGADLLLFDPEMKTGAMIQVKARSRGKDQGWHMNVKHEELIHPRLFYAFVNLEPVAPIVYVVPSEVVANVVRVSHQTWLGRPSKTGKPHRDSPLRRLRSSYSFGVPGFPDRWLEKYKEQWDLLLQG